MFAGVSRSSGRENSVFKNNRVRVALVTSVTLLLISCGGGSSSSGSGGSPNDPPTAYTLGGSITGLTASGLVLANGSATVSPAAGATTFTFSTALASGTAYDVAVQTQPSGEVCAVTSGTGTVGNSAINTVSVACQPQEFAYATGSGIYGYSVDFATGALTALPGNPLANVATSGNLLVDPAGHFLFAIEGGNIAVYGISATTGALTAVTGSPFSATGQADFLAIDPSGHFLYAAAVNSQVFAYSVDGTTGALTTVAGSPYAAGAGPRGVAVDSTGKFVYVVNNGTVSAYAINQTSGALAPVSGSPFPAGSVAGLTAAGTQGGDCFITADPHSNFVYVYDVTDSGATISPYAIDTSTGTLTAASGGSSYAGGSFCGTLAIDTSG
ncbi:MAG: lactonase family protein, partial [Bradyrhizobium sp.]